MPTIEYNTTAAKEHVSKAERTICTLKEQRQGLLATLPFSKILKQMKIKFIYFIVLWLNAFLVKTGILTMYSPRELLICWQLDSKKHCRVLPGLYCEVHDEPVQTNTMVWRTHKKDCTQPDWQCTRQHEILLHKYQTGTQALLIHTNAHA
jgi:hypothetical protein